MPKRLEHAILTISFVHKRRGDVSIKLFSPSGTESEMLSTRKYDDSTEGLDEWNFMTVFNWGKDNILMWYVEKQYISEKKMAEILFYWIGYI